MINDNEQLIEKWKYDIGDKLHTIFEKAAYIALDRKYISENMIVRRFKISAFEANEIIKQLQFFNIIDQNRMLSISKDEYAELITQMHINDLIIHDYEKREIDVHTEDSVVNSWIECIDNMDGHKFEYLCAEVLRKNRYENIMVTNASGDQGVDILASKDGIQYAIQCKRYSQTVGNKAVQEIYAGMKFYHAHVGIIITNNYFTNSAQKLAEQVGIVLWDRKFLMKQMDGNVNIRKISNIKKIPVYEEMGYVKLAEEYSSYIFEKMKFQSYQYLTEFLHKVNESTGINTMRQYALAPLHYYCAESNFAMGAPSLIYTFYCGIDIKFWDTDVGKKFENSNIFRMQIFYDLDDLSIDKIETGNVVYAEIDILPTNLDNMWIEIADGENSLVFGLDDDEFYLKKDDMQISNISYNNNDHLTVILDEYFEEAAKIVVDNDKASIGMLQRKFRINFNHACRIMDQLEKAGVVGPDNGVMSRKILVTPTQLEIKLEKLKNSKK